MRLSFFLPASRNFVPAERRTSLPIQCSGSSERSSATPLNLPQSRGMKCFLAALMRSLSTLAV